MATQTERPRVDIQGMWHDTDGYSTHYEKARISETKHNMGYPARPVDLPLTHAAKCEGPGHPIGGYISPPRSWRWFIRVCTDFVILGAFVGLLYYATGWRLLT